MIKCIGNCSKCGRCNKNEKSTDHRKSGLAVYPDDFIAEKGKDGYGLAVDIGTTTIVAMLWDLKTGQISGTEAITNSQNKYGMDVISRTAYCEDDESGLYNLRNELAACINVLLVKLQAERLNIVKAVICGNTTMSHIAAGLSPVGLARVPFTPAYKGMLRLSAEDMGINIAKDAEVILIPNIAGHVGGDITAGAIAARMHRKDRLTLFIDIGTNGEILLADGKTCYACSTAAGPAFEGASIRCGMRASDSAIEKIRIENDEVRFETIGPVPPTGICGSGIIDGIAQMLDAGIIDDTGRLVSSDEIESPELKERIVQIDEKNAFVIVARENGEDIVITQNDIREVQLAKAAVAAGINLMLADAGKNVWDIETVYVAGAFGSYIDKRSAVRIGLLPDVSLDIIESIGNAAGTGTSMALMSSVELDEMKDFAEKVNHVDLAGKEEFQMEYITEMMFMP